MSRSMPFLDWFFPKRPPQVSILAMSDAALKNLSAAGLSTDSNRRISCRRRYLRRRQALSRAFEQARADADLDQVEINALTEHCRPRFVETSDHAWLFLPSGRLSGLGCFGDRRLALAKTDGKSLAIRDFSYTPTPRFPGLDDATLLNLAQKLEERSTPPDPRTLSALAREHMQEFERALTSRAGDWRSNNRKPDVLSTAYTLQQFWEAGLPAWSRFLDRLGRPFVNLLAQSDALSVELFAFYQEPGHGERRRQAATAYPFLTRLLPTSPNLTSVVDRAEELAPALAQTLGCSAPTLKSLAEIDALIIDPTLQRDAGGRGLTTERYGQLPGQISDAGLGVAIEDSLPALVRAMDRIPRDLHPHTPSQAIILATAETIQPATFVDGPSYRRKAILSLARDWKATAAAVSNPNYLLAMQDFREAIETQIVGGSVAALLGLPTQEAAPLLQTPEAQKIIDDLAWGPNYLGRVRASESWHRRTAELTDIAMGERDLRWEALHAPLTTPDGVEISFLRTTAELRAEGEAMSHCVSVYDQVCFLSGRHIASLKTADARSTAELVVTHFAPDRSQVQIQIRQHFGPRNYVPAPEHETTLRWFIDEAWRAKEQDPTAPHPVSIDQARLEAALAERRGSWTSPRPTVDQLARLLPAWRPLLPRRFRLPWEEFIVATGIAALAKP